MDGIMQTLKAAGGSPRDVVHILIELKKADQQGTKGQPRPPFFLHGVTGFISHGPCGASPITQYS